MSENRTSWLINQPPNLYIDLVFFFLIIMAINFEVCQQTHVQHSQEGRIKVNTSA